MDKFLRVLRFLRITDEQNNISLTNLAIIAALINLLFCQHAGLTDVATFLGTVVGYQVKRFSKPANPASDTTELKAAIESLETRVTALHLGTQFRK